MFKKDPKTGIININSYMINESDIINDPNKTGDYNVVRYLSNF